MRLSVIIPAYNAEQIIVPTLEAVSEWLKQKDLDYEIIVVSDGSKDKTVEVLESFKVSKFQSFKVSKFQSLRVIDNKKNHGKGWVVKQGMLAATGDLRLFMDDDNSTTIDQLDNFLPYIDQGYEVVIGSIELSGAQVNEQAQWYRRFLGHVAKLIIRLGAGLWSIKDTQRGFKLFTEKAVKIIFPRVTITRWGFDFEVLAIAKKHGLKIKEVPVVWNNPSGSRVSLGSYISTFKDLLKVRLNLWSGIYD